MDAVIIAFASGKGGTGKSTTAVFVGGALAQLGKKVLLVELDSGLRSVDIIAGVSDETVFDLADVLEGRCTPDKAAVHSPQYSGLSLLAAPFEPYKVTAAGLKTLYQKVRGQYDYIFLDAAGGLDDSFRAAAKVAHRLFLVLTPDPVALRDGRAVANALHTGDDVPGRLQVRLIVNRVVPERIVRDGVLRDLDEAIDIVGVQLIGVVPESAAVQRAAAGVPLPKQGRESKVYGAIAGRILGRDVPLVVR